MSALASASASRVSASPGVVARACSRKSAAAVRGRALGPLRRPLRAGARGRVDDARRVLPRLRLRPDERRFGDDDGTFREFPRDAEGNVVDLDGNAVLRPENDWVREMEREGAATGYDERFFDDDWDDVNPNGPRSKTPLTDAERFPFKDIQDHEWRETMTWEDEEAEDAADPHYVASGPSGGSPGPTPDRPPPSTTPSESSRAGWTPPVQDLTQEEEATQMGFAPGEDEEEPEGPPAVLLAGFRAEECPRVRELLDELGGHDVPVVPVPQANLELPLVAALSLPEPDWLNPRTHDRFNQGGEFGTHDARASGLDRGEMATVVSALEARAVSRASSPSSSRPRTPSEPSARR